MFLESQSASNHKDIWIKKGYEFFALNGQTGLKVEPLAKAVGRSKSSFYHYFADIEIFLNHLLKHHIEQSKIIAHKEENASNIDPELIEILVEHKIDLLFNRQLRIHKINPLFSEYLQKSNKIVGDAFILVWIKDLNLKLSLKQIEGIFSLAIENFFLQINKENLENNWLKDYFDNLKRIASSLV